MLTPTHVQIAVLRTKDLPVKGKNGTNDAYIIFSLGKEKFQSSVQEKSSGPILEWNEGCDIQIPASQGNKAELVVKVYHKASMGDKFLGRLALPLSEFDVMAKPKAVWYPLRAKSGQEKDTKYRGEIEVRIKFLIKSSTNLAAESAHDLAGKPKRKDSFRSSLGSILSLGKKKKKKDKSGSGSSKETVNSSTDSLRNSTMSSSRLGLNNNLPIINDDPGVISEEDDIESPPLEFKIDRKKSTQSGVSGLSNSYSDKLNSSSLPSTPKNTQKSGLRDIFIDSAESPPPSNNPQFKVDSSFIDIDDQAQMSPKPRVVRLPSVIVEEPLSDSKSTVSSSVPTNHFATSNSPPKLTVSASMINLSDGKGSLRKTFKSMFTPSSKHLSVDEIFNSPEGGNAEERSRTSSNQSDHSSIFPAGFMMKKRNSIRDLKIPKDTFKLYERKSKEELVAIIINLQETADVQKQKINDMEDYIDKLLLRVLDNMPSLLKKGNSVRAE